MSKNNLAGKAQTVLGPIVPEALGITSSHEHILFDLSAYFMEPIAAGEKGLAHQPLSLDNLAWVRTHRFSNLDNLLQSDKELAMKELLRFKYAGGSTIVEMSDNGLGRDPLGLACVARATGLNIIMGSGYYIGLSHPKDMDSRTEELIATEITRDILVGASDTGIRAGIIGEIGCSTPLSKNEKKVLRACALAQRRTGAPMDIHPSFSDEFALEIVKILKAAGADLGHTVISHMDTFGFSLKTRLKLLDAGCYIAYDNFGNLGYPHPYLGRIANLTSDIQRINDIKELINKGYQKQILVGHDICIRDSLIAYGGFGYAHLLSNAVPLMRAMGITDEQINGLLVENPKRFLTFTKAQD
jgi:phosphotriesterase-related protein